MAKILLFAVTLLYNIITVSGIMQVVREHTNNAPVYSIQQVTSKSDNSTTPVNNNNPIATPTVAPSVPVSTTSAVLPIRDVEATEGNESERGVLNVVLTPTAGSISNENAELLLNMEEGLKHLRTVLTILSKFDQLLDQDDKTSKFDLDGKDYTFATTRDLLNKLIADGEEVQRVVIELGPLILLKLAAAKNTNGK